MILISLASEEKSLQISRMEDDLPSHYNIALGNTSTLIIPVILYKIITTL